MSARASKIQPQAIAPTLEPIRLADNMFDTVLRFYVKCAQDRAISAARQAIMLERTPPRRTFDLDSGHSPFLSKPAELADILSEIDRDLR